MLKIKELRLEKEWTQKELAEKIDTSNKNIWAWENKISSPSIDMLICLSNIFEVSVDYLIGKTDDVGFMPSAINTEYSSEERELIKKVRSLSPFDRELVVAQINRLAKDSVKI